MIEITKACTVTFMKASNYWLIDEEKNVSIRKRKIKWRNYIF